MRAAGWGGIDDLFRYRLRRVQVAAKDQELVDGTSVGVCVCVCVCWCVCVGGIGWRYRVEVLFVVGQGIG